MRGSLFLIVLFIVSLNKVYGQKLLSRNDHIFPASAEAKPFIDFDNKGFFIHGKRAFIVSASMEYARVPAGLWRDRLIRLKRAGFNAVEFYTFWNFHEPKEGEFDFSGDHDLDAFLKLLKELDMYAIARVGPYYCGEWNFGGYPIWLKFKPALRAREDNPAFLEATDKFFDKLIPIVAANQLHRGGPVIMVQLENEHPDGWGTIAPNNYFKHLVNKVVSLGIHVPYFFSGLHPGNDPAGNLKNLDDPARPNPWFSTEYWGVWFFNYGPQPQDSTIYDRRTWKIIAHGGNGYNVYMAHGGSNFGYNNDRDMAASYDYGAAVGQAGDLRPIYYGYKRAAWFARSFQEILANSSDVGNRYRWVVNNPSIQVNARTSPAGTIAFLDNPASRAVQVRINNPSDIKGAVSQSIKLAPGEIVPVVQNFSLAPGIKIEWAPTRLYGIFQQGQTTTLVAYGSPGSTALIYFSAETMIRTPKGGGNFRRLSSGKLEFLARILRNVPSEYIFEANGKRIRILVLSNALVKCSWQVETDKQTKMVIGPSFTAEMFLSRGKLMIIAEKPWNEKKKPETWVYGEDPGVQNFSYEPTTTGEIRLKNIDLLTWKWESASEQALPDFDDRDWKSSENPLQMGADGDITANAWYRTKLNVPETGNYTLQFKNLRERAALYLNGKRTDTGEVFNKSQILQLESGKEQTLAVFTAHNGRNKQLFYRGILDTIDAKGLSGEVTLTRTGANPNTAIAVSDWKMKGGTGMPDSTSGWKPLPGQVDKSPTFFRTQFILPASAGIHTVWRVNTTSLGHGSVWVNGHNLGRYPEKIKINGLYIPENWLKTGINTLLIYEEDGKSPAKVSIEAETTASRDVLILKGIMD